LKLTFERIGKNAASVFPDAVRDAKIKLSSDAKILAIAAV
jgi:hypothetical protein